MLRTHLKETKTERNDNDDKLPIHFATLNCSRPLELEEENNTRSSSPNSHYDSDVDNDANLPIHSAKLNCSRPDELKEESNTGLSSPTSNHNPDVDNNIIKLNTKSKNSTNEKIKQTNTPSRIKDDKGKILKHLLDDRFDPPIL